MLDRFAVKGKSTRESYIDVLKGVAMLGVILAHYFMPPNVILGKIALAGSRCPQFFFIASAFLTWKALDKPRSVDYKSFYKTRFFRIGPIYWLALLFALLLPVITIHQHSVGDLLTHVLFINGFVPQWTDNIMHVEWYISDLVILYLLCPFLRRYAYSLKTSSILLFFSIIISSLSLIVSNNVFATQIDDIPSWEMYFHTFFFLIQLPVWMLGVVTYYVVKEKNGVSWKVLLILFVIVIIINVLFEAFGLNKRFLSSSLIAGLDFTWLFLFCHRLKRLFHYGVFKPFKWFGIHSYGIYCFHFAVIRTLAFYGLIQTTTTKGWIVGFFISVLASVLIGYTFELCWNFIQNRIIK